MDATLAKGGIKTKKPNNLWARIYKCRFLYLIMFPVFVFYFIFRYLPMWGLLIVFQEYRPFLGLRGSSWVGFAHFQSFLTNPIFWNVVANTIVLSIYGILFVFPAPIILALMLNEVRNMKFKRTIQTISYLPFFISTVVIVSLVTGILSPTTGPIAQVYRSLGMQPVHFLASVEYFRAIFTLSDVWRTIGFSSIIYLAALSGIDPSLYEAATIDGAGRFKQMLHITVPGIMPTVVILLILRVGAMMETNFEMAFLLGNPANRPNADVIATYVFRTGIHQSNFSFAAAVGLFNSLVALVLVWGTNRLSSKLTGNSLW